MINKIPEDDILLKNCLAALKENSIIIDREEAKEIWQTFKKNVPIIGSRIDWSKINRKITIEFIDQTVSFLEKILNRSFDHSIYIMWNDASLPMVKTSLEVAISKFDNIIPLGFEIWMYNPKEGYVIEYHYSEGIHAGSIQLDNLD